MGAAGTAGPEAAGPGPEVVAFLDHLTIERRLAPRTVAMYREALLRLEASAAAEGVVLRVAGPHHLRGWMMQLRHRGLAPRSIAIAQPFAEYEGCPRRFEMLVRSPAHQWTDENGAKHTVVRNLRSERLLLTDLSSLGLKPFAEAIPGAKAEESTLGYMAIAAGVDKKPEYAAGFAAFKANFAVPALLLEVPPPPPEEKGEGFAGWLDPNTRC